MTDYAYEHPAGPGYIHPSCGDIGTSAYAQYHSKSLLSLVEDDIVGLFDTSSGAGPMPAPTPEVRVSRDELEMHNTPSDCWVAYYEFVYDMTVYADEHPKVGPRPIQAFCGSIGTEFYARVHQKDLLALIDDDKVGRLDSGAVAAMASGALAVSIFGMVFPFCL